MLSTSLYDAELIEENFREFAVKGLAKMLEPLDKIAAKNVRYLVPTV